MASTTKGITGEYRGKGMVIEHPINSDSEVFENALVGFDTTSGNALDATSSTPILGVAYTSRDGAKNEKINVRSHLLFKIALSGAAREDIGKTAYAANNQTATLTAGAAILGRIMDIEDSENIWVFLNLETVE